MYALKHPLKTLKKIWKHKEVLPVRLSQDEWDHQFQGGKWDYLLEGEPHLAGIAALCIQSGIKKKKKPRILDVGCGNGALPLALKQVGIDFEYFGTDISDVAVKQARANFPEGTFSCSDMEHGFAGTEKFDLIIFADVLYYCDAVSTVLAYKKNIKNDGRMIVSMYATLRSRFIWLQLASVCKNLYRYRVCSCIRHACWDIKLSRLQ